MLGFDLELKHLCGLSPRVNYTDRPPLVGKVSANFCGGFDLETDFFSTFLSVVFKPTRHKPRYCFKVCHDIFILYLHFNTDTRLNLLPCKVYLYTRKIYSWDKVGIYQEPLILRVPQHILFWKIIIYPNLFLFFSLLLKQKKNPWSESAIELYRPSDCRLSAKWLSTFCG
jgi:hypothetical protein